MITFLIIGALIATIATTIYKKSYPIPRALLKQAESLEPTSIITVSGDVGFGEVAKCPVTIVEFGNSIKVRVGASRGSTWVPDVVIGDAMVALPLVLHRKARNLVETALLERAERTSIDYLLGSGEADAVCTADREQRYLSAGQE